MSTPLWIPATCLLLVLTTASQAATESGAAGFRIEVLVHKAASDSASIPVECLYGCAWDKQVIDCPAEAKECRVIIDGRFGIEPWSKDATGVQTVLPWSGTVCLGLLGGTNVRKVEAGSPAELAGIKTGDLFAGLNGVSLERPEDLHDMVKRMEAGQPFEATLKRNGMEIQVSGQFGIWTTAGCRPAAPELLALPGAELLPMAPFSIAIDDLTIPIELKCLEGCDLWRPMPVSACPPPTHSCTFRYTVHDRSGTQATEDATSEIRRGTGEK
jgi:PDZ domain